MSGVCTRCSAEDIDTTDDGYLTCLGCGCILEETNLRVEVDLVTNEGGTRACGSLVSATSTGTSVATSLPRSSAFRNKPTAYLAHGASNSVQKSIEKIASLLRIDKPTADMMQFMYSKISERGRYCRSPDLLAATIAYIILRREKKPFSMLDVSVTVQLNVFALGRVYGRVVALNDEYHIRDEIEPSVFVEKTCMEMTEWPEQKKTAIKLAATKIINCVKSFWITTGRRHNAVSAAAILMAGEALNLSVEIQALTTALKVTEATVKARVREIKRAILEIGLSVIPSMKEVDLKSIHKHLPKILETLDRLKTVVKKIIKEKKEDDQLKADSENSSPLQITNDPPLALPSSNPLCNSSSSIPSPVPITPTSTSTSTPTPTPTPTPTSTPIPTPTSYVPTAPTLVPSTPRHQSTTSTISELKQCYRKPTNLPHSFKVNSLTRERRIQKIHHAKQRLLISYMHCPGAYEHLPQLRANLESTFFVSPPFPSGPSAPESKPLLLTLSPFVAPPSFSPSPVPSPTSPFSPSLSPSTSPLPPSPSSSPSSSSASSSPSSSPTLSPSDNPLHRHRAVRVTKPKREKKVASEDVSSTMGPTLDDEDLLIEKLLVNGADESAIIDGYYNTEISKANNATTIHHNLESDNLDELDIPDSEMHKFIRTPQEIDILTQLANGSEPGEPSVPKKTTTSKRKARAVGEDGAAKPKRKRVSKPKVGNSSGPNPNEASEDSGECDDELRELAKLPPSTSAF